MNHDRHYDRQSNERPAVDQFANHLRDIGCSIPLGDDDVGLANVRRNLRTRRRRRRMIPITAAAAVGVAAITGGAVGLSRSSDVLTVATAPPQTDAPSTSMLDQPSTTTVDSSPEVTTPNSVTEDAVGSAAPATGIGREAVDATVGDVLAPPLTDAQPVDVTASVPVVDQTPPPIWTEGASHSDEFDWLVVRGDEFLLGNIRMSGSPDPIGFELYSSTDGRSWEEVDVQVPDDFGSALDVAATNDRLVVLAGRDGDGRTQTVVWETTDFTDWTAHPIDTPNPADGFPDTGLVNGSSRGLDVAVNDEAWAVHMNSSVSLDLEQLIADRTGRDVTSWGSGSDSGPYIDVLVYGDEADGTQDDIVDEFRVDFVDDLGLTPDQAAQLGRRTDNEMWVGDWTDAAPRRVDDLPPGSFAGVSATDDALIGWTASQVGVLVNGDDTLRSFAPRPDVAERSSLYDVYPDGRDLVVLSGSPDGSSSFDVLAADDSGGATWIPLDLTPLPPIVLDGYRSTDEAATIVETNPFPASTSTTSTVVIDGLRFTQRHDPPFSSYEVVDTATGDVIVAETIDSRTLADPRVGGFRYQRSTPDDGLEVLDPESGDVVLTLSREERGAFYENRTTFDGDSVVDPTSEDLTPQDRWLVDVNDGRWFVHQLAGPELDEDGHSLHPSPGLVASNGSTVLLQVVDGWELFDLET